MGDSSISDSLAVDPSNVLASQPQGKVPLLDLARENGSLSTDLLAAFQRVLQSGRFVLGPECEQLESAIAQRCGTIHAIGCASGSDALLLSLMAAGVGPGDEVICPSFTFFATASAITRLGATPVFADILADTFNVNPDHVSALVTDRTKAMVPVHLFGQCAEMKPLADLAAKHKLVVVEDCAQSIDAHYDGLPSGSMSSAGCFSFYPTKNLGGFGDGGMITTSDDAFADRLRLLRAHGMRPRYYHQQVGINSRLDTIQAALLLVKLPYLSAWTKQRVANAERYDELFRSAGLTEWITLPKVAAGCGPVWNQYTIRVTGGRRDGLREHLRKLEIGTEIYYPIPLHRQECFAEIECPAGSLPQTEAAAGEVLSLPVFPGMTKAEQDRVVASIASYMHSGSKSSVTVSPTTIPPR